MGGKSSKSHLPKKSLNLKEEERVLSFFGLQNTNDKISMASLKERWQTMLVPSFLDQLVNYLVKQSQTTDPNIVTMDAMVSVYLKFVRGTLDEIAAAIADVIGSTIKNDKEIVVSYNSVSKYLSDLISSYLKLLENNKDKYLMSWHARSRKFDSTSLSAVVKAWCAELIHEDDETLQITPNGYIISEVRINISIIHDLGCGKLQHFDIARSAKHGEFSLLKRKWISSLISHQ